MEEKQRRVTSIRQLEILFEVMEQNREIAMGCVRSKEARAQSHRVWSACARRLNAEGPKRSAREWAKVWTDYKCKVRTKLMHRRRGYSTDGGCTINFTPFEERVASLIRDWGSDGVRKDPIEVTIIENDTKDGILQNNTSSRDSIEKDYWGTSSEESNEGVEVNIKHLSPSPVDVEGYEIKPTQFQQLPITAQRPYRIDNGRPKLYRRTQPAHQQNTDEFTEAWTSISHIEEQRARTDEMQAAANLKQAEAALKTAEAMQSFAQSLKIIAKSVQKFTNFYTEKR